MRSRPAIADVMGALREEDALIVHFSGAPKGSGIERGLYYPADLQRVIDGQAQGGLSCSTVKPTDQFSGFNRNATGCIGCILLPLWPSSVVDVSSCDFGSSEDKNGLRTGRERPTISLDDVRKSITDRRSGDYNEWVVRRFAVVGILAAPPFDYTALRQVPFPEDMPDYLRTTEAQPGPARTSLTEVARTFPKERIFSFEAGRIVQLTKDGLVAVTHFQVYESRPVHFLLKLLTLW